MIAMWAQKLQLQGSSPQRAGAVGFAVGDYGYVGFGTTNPSISGGLISDLWRWDKANNTWTQMSLAGIPNARKYVSCFVIGTDAYVGLGEGASNRYFLKYDSTQNSWSQVGNPHPGGAVNFAQACSVNGKGYVIGGGSPNIYWDQVYEFNPADGTWAQKAAFASGTPSYPSGVGWLGQFIFGVGSHIYTVCGSFGGVNAKKTFKFDPGNNIWTEATPYPGTNEPTHGFSVGTTIYVGNDAELWGYNTIADNWTQISNPHNVITKQGASFVIGDKAYLAVGWNGSSTPCYDTLWEYSQMLETPTNLQVAYINDNTARLTWNDNTVDETNYIVERRRNDEASYSEIHITGPLAGNGTWDDTNVDLVQFGYWYRVKAVKAG